jgi:hypothetical protein
MPRKLKQHQLIPCIDVVSLTSVWHPLHRYDIPYVDMASLILTYRLLLRRSKCIIN